MLIPKYLHCEAFLNILVSQCCVVISKHKEGL